MKYDNILQTVGNTPIIRLNKVTDSLARELWVKVESFNPAGSVKDRPALNMIEEAERRGLIKPGDVIIEPTSGNTGIGIAMVAAVKGYPAVMVMAEDMSDERKKILRAYGAELVLTPAEKGTKGAIEEAKRLADEKGWFFIGQHFNPDNPGAHKQTAREIIADFGDDLDAIVCTTGTGGTISGLGRNLREYNPDLKVIATEPADSPILTQGIARKHKIMGTAPGFIPEILDTEVWDEVVQITTEEAYESTRYLAREEGIFAGISSGAAVAGMIKVASPESFRDKVLLAILPDTGERYLSTDVWD
ncbi:cysteine synthase A [Solemya velesiana gill symbiont]|uniref:Cysteine synthase n=1 Tax=Solemya velesiana gill symbiont TaxID=1918948 RepID=A0A1T2KXX6_9GAMM|nr:cysteine synthase A [Solemya velesiana gill symbiont]OOZ37661.1 cysteine synthase A [Solemya velesiana gill symbiont]